MSRTLREAIAVGPVVLDGGLATQLVARGHDLSDTLCAARLLLDDPAEVRAAHADFFAAGAQVATTASYQVSESGFRAAGRTVAEARTALRRSVIVAREAADDAAACDGRLRWVAASVGPYGATLADGSEYRGDDQLSVAQLREWHRPRLALLAEAGADVLAVETVPSLREVEAVCRELASLGMPFWLSVTPAAGRTRDGESLADAFRIAAETPGILAVGANCCEPSEFIGIAAAAKVAASAHALGSPEQAPAEAAQTVPDGIPLVFYPNSGEVWDAQARAWRGEPTVGGLAPEWVDGGARLVGGCCRVTPAQIGVLAAGCS